MSKVFLIISFLVSLNFYAQEIFKGTVLDSETSKPIPYVNIGIVDKGLGTVSDEDGYFFLILNRDNLTDNDFIRFSSLGYKSYEISITETKDISEDFLKVPMNPTEVELDEVTVSTKPLYPTTEFIGYQNLGEPYFFMWNRNRPVSAELASLIKIRDGIRKLNLLEFEIHRMVSDSLLVRVNIYDKDYTTGLPGANLNKSNENILFTIRSKEPIVNINLEPFDIYVRDDFFVGLELVQQYDEQPMTLVIKASNDLKGSYNKFASQDRWTKMTNYSAAFYLKTTALVDEKRAKRNDKKVRIARKKDLVISGFVISQGSMLKDVEVFNNRTKELVYSDANGRYTIHARIKDQLLFYKSGFEKTSIILEDKKFKNVILER